MNDLIGTGIGAVDVGAGGLVFLFVLSILRGWIVPRSVLDDVRADRDVRLAAERADKEHWRSVAETSTEQVKTLLSVTQVTTQVLQSLPAPVAEVDP